MISSNSSYFGANLICEGFVVKKLLSEQYEQMKIIPLLPIFLHNPAFNTLFSYKMVPVFVFNKSGIISCPHVAYGLKILILL